ncbi:hypothetical protein [Burkholderia cenocepacia]|uniref:hypothetical protein n=1 Tax=Burkholderia cenocepacia TaxID=95486 RepID=UPI001B919391|nr:hypothetical protein [Burkholderia cenocepacia]MBR8137197.1 hypothetical protein [Burkholderia cenocepacia]
MPTEKRNSRRKYAQLPLPFLDGLEGVGVRKAQGDGLPQGGGYLDICTDSKFDQVLAGDHDPRLDELAEMGLPRHWLDIAALLGVDAFLQVWRLLDAAPTVSREGSTLELQMRPYRSYLRAQRSRLIAELVERGCSTAEVCERVREQFPDMTMSPRHAMRWFHAHAA